MGKINVTVLTAELSAIRNEGNHDRENCKTKVLHCLGYTDDKSVSIPEFDAFLIRATSERFGVSANRDIVLMAFGLLGGYHYEEIDETEDRRDKYLTDSNHQQTRARKKEPYVGASDKRKKALRGNLRKMEKGLIESLAYYLAKQAKNDDNDAIKKYIKSHISPITTPQPIYILSEDEPEPTPVDDDVKGSETNPDTPVPPEVLRSDKSTATDVDTFDETDQNTVPHPEDAPSNTGGKQDSRSKEKSQSDMLPADKLSSDGSESPPPPQITNIYHYHTSKDSHDIHISDEHNQFHINVWLRMTIVAVFVIAVIGLIGMAYVKFFSPPPPPVEEIFLSKDEITLRPGEEYPLKIAILPVDAGNSTLSFVSSATDIVTVSPTGVLTAHDNSQGELYREAEITIQAESGVTKTKTVTVDFSNGRAPEVNKEVAAGYYVWQKIRLAGTDEWADTVDAEIGDIVEIQIQYKNIGENTQENVMIRDVLPPNLVYVPETTKLYNVKYDGAKVNQNTIVTTGINIGNYTSGSNAYVRFSAKVVDITLAPGSNTLVNWSQAGVGQITLSDYATAVVQK